MNHPLPHYVLHRFSALCLGCGLLALPVHPALAETIIYDDSSSSAMLQNTSAGGLGNDLAPSGNNSGLGYINDSISGNMVIINGGPLIPGDVYGAINAKNAETVSNNQVFINSGSIGGMVFGGFNPYFGTVTDNHVTISGGTVDKHIFGGYVINGTAIDNSVTINGGTVKGDVDGGRSNSSGNATGNNVTISGGTVGGNVYGGFVYNGAATGNSVIISDGAVTGSVYGGYASGTSGTSATGNSVTISGGTVAGSVFGGQTLHGGDAFTGNTLNLWNCDGVRVVSVQNFQYYNFILPENLPTGGVALLTVTGASGPIDLSRSTVTGIGLGDNQVVALGDTVKLIYAPNSDLAHLAPTGATSVTSTDAAGMTTTWKLLPSGTNLDAFLTSLETNGNLARPGGYTVHSSASDAVSLKVGGILSVGGALTLDNSLGGGVSVNVGILQIGDTGTTMTATGLNPGDATIGALLLTNDQNFILTGRTALVVSVGRFTIDGGTLNDANWGNLVGGGITYSTSQDITLGMGGATVDLSGDHISNRNLIGTGGLTKQGAGTLILTGVNTYSGGTTVNAGTLQIGPTSTTSTDNLGTGEVFIDTGATLAATTNGAFSFDNALIGAGTLTASNNGAAFSFGAETGAAFTGKAALSNNTFTLSGDNTTALTNATLSLGAGSVTTVGAGNQRIGGLVFNGGTAIFDAAAPAQTAATGLITVGTLDVSGTGTVQINVPNPYPLPTPTPAGDESLFQQSHVNDGLRLVAATTVIGSAGGLALQDQSGNALGSARNVNIAQNGNTVAVGTYNYMLGTGSANDGLYVGYGLTQLNLQAGQSLTLTENAGATGNDADLAAQLTGDGNLVIAATDTVTLSNPTNSFAGTTTVQSGTLKAGATNVIASSSALTLNDGTTFDTNGYNQSVNNLNGAGQVTLSSNNMLTLNGAATNIFSGVITGMGGLTQASGTEILTGANAYSGGTIISGGTLQLGNGGTTGSIAGDVANNGTLAFNRSDTITFSGVISGSGGVVQTGTGTTVLTGVNTYSGGTTVNAGTLAGDARSLQGDMENNANVEFNQSAAGTYAGVMSGTGALTKTGEETLTLSGNNSYSGGTTISVGALEVTGSLGNGNYTGIITNDAALIMNQSADQTLSGVISGSGSLTKDGAGTLTLTGANTYTGLTEVQAGTLALSGAGGISNTLALHEGATFATGGNAINLDQLDVYGSSSWQGDLTMGAGQNMNFFLPATLDNGGTMLTVSGTATIADATVNVGINGASSPLRPGDTVTLIEARTVNGIPANQSSDSQWLRLRQGVTIDYTFELRETATQLLATITGAKAADQSKALSEGFVSGPVLLNETSDFVADQGMAQAVEAAGGKPGAGKRTRANAATGYGLGVFGSMSGGWSRYDTGSNVDMSSMSLIAGLAWGNDLAPARLTLGAFFEYGNGWYDTYNSFSEAPDARGKGNIYHLGGGILGRLDFSGSGLGNFYTEVSLRAGGVNNDYKNGDFAGGSVSYDSSTAYYGAHAALGYAFNLKEKTVLDLYGKYFWTRQNGDSVTLSTGESISFDSVDSHRLRVGGRFVYAVSEVINPYAGMAYEQEFDGKARATTNGLAIDAPSLHGGTGIGELGLNLRPAKRWPLSCDLGVQGYFGTREGFTASARARYDF